MLTNEKMQALEAVIRRYKNAVISLSGGTDSVAIAAAAKEYLGADNVKAVTAITAFLTEEEIRRARSAAAELGLEYRLVRVHCMRDENVIRNDERICYYCKKVILSGIETVLNQCKFDIIFDGGTLAGGGECTPSGEAAKEFPIISPFREVGFDKDDIKEFMINNGLERYIMSHNNCLAKRIKTGQHLDFFHIRLVCAAENYLENLGFSEVRCNVEGYDAHVTVADDEMDELILRKDELSEEFLMMGFKGFYIDEK